MVANNMGYNPQSSPYQPATQTYTNVAPLPIYSGTQYKRATGTNVPMIRPPVSGLTSTGTLIDSLRSARPQEGLFAPSQLTIGGHNLMQARTDRVGELARQQRLQGATSQVPNTIQSALNRGVTGTGFASQGIGQDFSLADTADKAGLNLLTDAIKGDAIRAGAEARDVARLAAARDLEYDFAKTDRDNYLKFLAGKELQDEVNRIGKHQGFDLFDPMTWGG